MSDTLKDLKARAAATQAEADAAQAEAIRLSGAAESFRVEALARAEWARVAAEDLANEELKAQTADADANAATLVAQADKLTEKARAATLQSEALTADAVKARALANTALAAAAALAASIKPSGNYVRTEGGGFAEVQSGFGPRSAQVTGADGRVYDHVSDHASGDWVYRGRGPSTVK